MLSRRQMLKGLVTLTAGVGGFGGYALAEPFRLGVTRYRLSPPGWPAGLKLRLAVLADIHACKPWMTVERIRQIVARTNAVAPDATLLLGDFVVGHRLGRLGWNVPHDEWAGALAELRAPLGVHAVLGNHDWWEDPAGAGAPCRSREGGARSRGQGHRRLPERRHPAGKRWARLSGSRVSAINGRSGLSREDYDEFKRGGKIDYVGRG